jgi:hypothetical protein
MTVFRGVTWHEVRKVVGLQKKKMSRIRAVRGVSVGNSSMLKSVNCLREYKPNESLRDNCD